MGVPFHVATKVPFLVAISSPRGSGRVGQGGGEVRRCRGSRVMPAEGRDLRWKRWRKGAGSREWPMAYHPGDEQECRMSSHAQAKGTTRAVAVARASTGLTTHRPAQGCEPGARARETRPLVVTGKPVREPHDSTGEPGAGNRPAGLCVQPRLACSAGDSPAGARIRSPVAWIAGRRETKFLKPIDRVSLGEIASHRAVT